jgi:acyl-coenzyme A thioesterase 9
MVVLTDVTKPTRPVPIAAIIVETPEEHRLFQLGESQSAARKQQSQSSLTKHTPNASESALIHSLWQEQLSWHDPHAGAKSASRKPANVFFMDTTTLRTASIMQPQYRNRHHFMIFGGFLLKQTFELAFCCAASFSRARPSFVSLDPSTFLNPVPVGSVLYMTSTVTYTDPPAVPENRSRHHDRHSHSHRREHDAGEAEEAVASEEERGQTRIQVRVDTKVRNVEHGETKPTGQFNYTFVVDKDVKVMPRTYTEFMMYIDARRRAKRVAELMRGGEVTIKGVTE